MATSTLEKFSSCGDRYIPREPSACPLLAQILGLIGAAESSEPPEQGGDISVLGLMFRFRAKFSSCRSHQTRGHILLFGSRFIFCAESEPKTRFPLGFVCSLGGADRDGRMLQMKSLFRPHNLLH